MASSGSAAWGENDWSTSFWACGGSLSICCSACWCPCVVYAHNQEELTGNDRFWRSCLTFAAIPAAFALAKLGVAGVMLATAAPGTVPAALHNISLGLDLATSAALASFAARGRAALRQRLSLPEAPCSDWTAWFCCAGLALCQEAAQLRRHKEERDAELAAGRYSKLSLEAPEAQSMLA